MGVLQNLTDLYLCRRYSIKKEMMKWVLRKNILHIWR
jgi:hypothetical protein